MAAQGFSVCVVTDTPRAGLDLPGVRIVNTPLGARLLSWTPVSRLGWTVRHALQIVVFSVASTLLTIPHRLRGSVVFNHNCEALMGQVLVMHNVFSAELDRRDLGLIEKVRAYLNPVRAMRIAKERVMSRSSGRILIAVSEDSARDVEALTRRSARVEVIPNGIDIEHFSPAVPAPGPSQEFQEWWDASECESLVAFIGHEFKRKGLFDLMDALDHLPGSVGLVVMGGGAEPLSEHRDRVRRSRHAGRVLFTGEVADVRPYLRRSHVLCLPSYYESLGLVGLEALACGVPIVVTHDQPLARFIVPGLNGATCDHDPRRIAEALRGVLASSSSHTAERVAATVNDLGWDPAVSSYSRVAREAARTGIPR